MNSKLVLGHLFIEPKIGDLISLDRAFEFAIHLAFKGAGYTSPNPLVGCVILNSENRLLSFGFHEKYGELHAEANALKGLDSAQLKNATAIVTLEPCAHKGKTPSCAQALARTPIKKVIYGLQDPNPLVAGKGAEIISNAGISTELWPNHWKEKLETVCEHFLKNFIQRKPFVSLKFAASLDGVMHLNSGESQWITGEKAREEAHYLRGTHDAVLVGHNTLKIDNPSLNVRHPLFRNKKNKVVVLTRGQISKDPSLNIFKKHASEDLIFEDSEQSLNKILENLWNQGIKSILVEGGPKTLSRFIEDMAWDRMYFFQAPVILGGQSGQIFSSGLKLSTMEDKVILSDMKYEQLGSDLLITGKRK